MLAIDLLITNDIPFDQRMRKICTSLAENGYKVKLIGRKKSNKPLTKAVYGQKRISCLFQKGKLFYIEYNIRLFLYLVFKSRASVYCAIDTDTLLGCWAASKLKRKKLVFDAHEYFTEMEEVVNRPITRSIWKWVENICIPSVSSAYTISEGYASLFEKRFNKKFEIVRNATVLKDEPVLSSGDRKFILYQGSVNIGRGLEELIEAMKNIDYPLVICGDGDIFQSLQVKVKQMHLQDKVRFTGYLPPDELIKYTAQAKIGITLFSNEGLSNHHSLCNRFFDYMHAGVPQITVNYPEYQIFNERLEISVLMNKITPESIAKSINELLKNEIYYEKLFNNSLIARQEFNWQQEEKKLLRVYEDLVLPTPIPKG